jgi:hypothetical protein
MEGWTLAALMSVHGWQEKEMQLLLGQVRAELKRPGNYTYYNFYVLLSIFYPFTPAPFSKPRYFCVI